MKKQLLNFCKTNLETAKYMSKQFELFNTPVPAKLASYWNGYADAVVDIIHFINTYKFFKRKEKKNEERTKADT